MGNTKADKVKEQMEEPAEHFDAAQTGPHHYTVRTDRGDTPRAHRVNILNVRCSCEDMTYNKSGSSVNPESDGGVEICDHLAFVLREHPQLTAEEMSLYQSMGLMRQAESLRDQLDMQLDRFEDALVELRDANAGDSAEASAETTQSDTGGSPPDSVANAADKAAELQAAFDDVLDDMEVEAHEGHVWFKTGYETPDEWPYPGGDETFKVVTKPDVVQYVHDGSPEWANSQPHELYDSKPGEYFRNALDPDDVDEYISEVLN